MSSVLDSIKIRLGVGETNTDFDGDIIPAINGALAEVKTIGAGKDGVRLYISDKNVQWTTLFDDDEILQMVQDVVFMIAKLTFDPPGTSFGIEAVEKQIKKQKWLITSMVEEGSVSQ